MKSLRQTRQRVGRISSAAGITALLVGGVSAGAVLVGPAGSAFADGNSGPSQSTCSGTVENLSPPPGQGGSSKQGGSDHEDSAKPSYGTACYTVVGSKVDVTVTLNSGLSANNEYLCYATTDLGSSFNSPSQCAGQTGTMFAGQATPQGGLQTSGNPVAFALDVVSNPMAGQMQVAPGDYLYLHVGVAGGESTCGSTLIEFGDPFQVPPANGVPVANPAIAAGIIGVGALGLGLVGVRRRRSRVALES